MKINSKKPCGFFAETLTANWIQARDLPQQKQLQYFTRENNLQEWRKVKNTESINRNKEDRYIERERSERLDEVFIIR